MWNFSNARMRSRREDAEEEKLEHQRKVIPSKNRQRKNRYNVFYLQTSWMHAFLVTRENERGAQRLGCNFHQELLIDVCKTSDL